MPLTRSQAKNMEASRPDEPTTTSPADETPADEVPAGGRDDDAISLRSMTSAVSVASTTRRRQLLDLELETAEAMAAIELEEAKAKAAAEQQRRASDVKRRLLTTRLALQTAALEDEGRRSRASSRASSVTDMRPTMKTILQMPTVTAAACDAARPKDHRDHPEMTKTGDMAKFLARQTSIKELPQFCGDPEEWPLFYAQFVTTTRLCGYSDDENIARLAKCLKGHAREAVSALLVTATNLEIIIKTLRLRFGRPELLIEVMLLKIHNIRDIRQDDVNLLIEYATIVQNIVATMKMTNEVGHLTNPTLIREIIGKLPMTLKYQWSFSIASRGESKINLNDVSEWLMMVANAATTIAPLPTADRQHHQHTKQEKKFVHATTPTTSMTTAPTRTTCALCQHEHALNNCSEFKRLSIDDRWKLVTERKLCFCCLSLSHQLKSCRRKTKCSEGQCTRLHHPLLHAAPRNETNERAQTAATVNHCGDATSTILLKVAPVVISGPSGDVEALALLDEGASVSLIDDSLLKRAGITGPTATLQLRGATGMRTSEPNSKRVNITVRGRAKEERFVLYNMRSVNNLYLPVHNVNINGLLNDFPHLTDLLQHIDRLTYNERPQILIGSDNIDLIVTRRAHVGPTGPIVSETSLGNIVHGKLSPLTPTDATIYHLCPCDALNDMVRRSFSTDGFGTKPFPDTPRSREDLKALAIMEKTTKLVGDRWETGLLWRDDAAVLPDSRAVAQKRLVGVTKKMDSMPEFAARYREKVEENLEKCYLKKLTETEQVTKTDKTWYLPHFAVFNPNKPNKLRLVLDCAAKSSGKSLNDFLLSGPDFLTSLAGILLGFRCGKIAVMGDIQEMFHRVLIREEDQQAQRLLWDGGEYAMNVMTFGAVCSPSSAQYVKNLNATRFKTTHPKAVDAIVEHHYVDDFIYSIDEYDEALQVVNDVISIHAKGGFNMRNFMSNSKRLLGHLPEDKLAPGGAKMLSDDKNETMERVLGLNWDPEDDSFTFLLKFHKVDCDISAGVKRPTKRDVLKLVMSVFDPLGFLLYVTVQARILLQDIWKSKIGWDDEIETCHFHRWQAWLQELNKTTEVRIPRWLSANNCDKHASAELHVFCDASSRAFVSVAYLRRKTADGVWHVAMIMARARVAPLKVLSIPRLELQAAVMGARLSQVLKRYIGLPINKIKFWTDSKTVLSWLRSETGRFKPFVAHRVSEVFELTDVCDWRWVPTDMNPADDATRDVVIASNDRWLRGPDFLRQREESWPQEDERSIALDLDDVEVKAVNLLTSEANGALPDDSRFSSYWRLIRSTAWIFRFIHNSRGSGNRRTGELTASDLRSAETAWVKESQRRNYSREIASILSTEFVDKTSSLRQLTPFLDADDVLRVSGRITASNVAEGTKHPAILHPKDTFTKLLLQQYHKDAGHAGREMTLNNVRQRFWICNGRNAVKATWNTCQKCKIDKAKPVPPLMGQLPDVRLKTGGRAFRFTGLDYFGPMTVKVGRRHEKRYGALFTCLTVRAVHVELVHDLTTSSAIMALRRFIARRGCPEQMWSDNATTFKGADNELKQSVRAIDQEELLRYGSIRQIEWHFIAPQAPHMGGCWERLVRSIKTAMKATLKEVVPSDQTLQTVVAEAEAIVNTRPLTYVPLDHVDDLPLTPNDFLLAKTNDFDQPFGSFGDGDLLRRNWREGQRLADLVWKRWLKEYLPTLTRRDKWYGPTTRPITDGDLVIIADDQAPRNLWLRGVVTKTYRGPDGLVRVADVNTRLGPYRRAAAKLCRLDVQPPGVLAPNTGGGDVVA